MKPANIKIEAPSGGATILVRKDLCIAPGYFPRAKQDPTSNSMMVCLRVKGCNMILVSAYLNPVDPSIKYQTMEHISSWVNQFGCPWLIGGDYNTTPDDLTQMEWDVLGRGIIHTPPVEKTVTLHNGRMVDYAIMDHSMHCLVQETLPVLDAPCRPHMGIMYKIAARTRHIMVPKFIRPKKIERTGELRDQIPFDACFEKADKFKNIKPLPEIVDEYVQSLPDPEANLRMATE